MRLIALNATTVIFYFALTSCVSVCIANTGIDGDIVASSLTVTGPVLISSLTATSATITNLTTAGVLGKVIQIVNSTTSTSMSTSSTNFTDTNLSATITPTSSSNKILILTRAFVEIAGPNPGDKAYTTINRGSTNLGNSTQGWGQFMAPYAQTVGPFACHDSIVFLDSPATTSPTTYTYRIKVGSSSDTAYQSRNGEPCSMVLLEVTP